VKAPVCEALHRNKKAVEVHVEHHPIHNASSYMLIQRAPQRVNFALKILQARKNYLIHAGASVEVKLNESLYLPDLN
jgi:hypothetical protein